MTDTPRRWDRLTAESDPAFEAFAAYLDTGSLRDAYRQRSGKAQATAAPGAWTGWSTKYNWVSRRAAFVEFTVRECQDATQLGLVQIRRRFIDTANTLLDDGSVPAVRAASRVIVENFPPVGRVADVSDGPDIEDLCDIPDADIDHINTPSIPPHSGKYPVDEIGGIMAERTVLLDATAEVRGAHLTLITARPRPVPLAHLPDVRAHAPAAAHVAASLPAVRRGPGQGGPPRHC